MVRVSVSFSNYFSPVTCFVLLCIIIGYKRNKGFIFFTKPSQEFSTAYPHLMAQTKHL